MFVCSSCSIRSSATVCAPRTSSSGIAEWLQGVCKFQVHSLREREFDLDPCLQQRAQLVAMSLAAALWMLLEEAPHLGRRVEVFDRPSEEPLRQVGATR